jgi:GTP cyclohydrolase I
VLFRSKQTEDEFKDKWLVFPWEKKNENVEDNFVRILQYLGEDPTREGLRETPKRYIKFLKEFLEPKEFNFTSFDAEGTDEMIIQTNIPFYSLCEHHVAPFFGTANVAYIPNGKIVGLSKLARTVDLFANRFQNQERITTQIANKINEELNPKGVAVTLKAQHLCMCMRGVKKHDTWTQTSKMIGVFKTDQMARNEFLNLIK